MSTEKLEIQDLFSLRRYNPLVVYGAPWRLGRFLRVIWLLMMLGSVTGCVATVYLVDFFRGFALLPVLAPYPLMLCALVSFKGEWHPERLEEYRLTRLSREEVVFGLHYWGVVSAALVALIWTIGFVMAMASVFPFPSGLVGSLAATPFLGGFWCVVLAKQLRLCLAVRRHYWTIPLITPLAMLFDLVVVAGTGLVVYFIVCPRFADPSLPAVLLGTAAGMVAMAGMVFWNLHVAMEWGVALYYRERDGVAYRQLFLPTSRERDAILTAIGWKRTPAEPPQRPPHELHIHRTAE